MIAVDLKLMAAPLTLPVGCKRRASAGRPSDGETASAARAVWARAGPRYLGFSLGGGT